MNYFNYFTEIEEAFIRRRGRHLSLSPLDWALIESWQKRGIPIRLVLRGIESVFDSIGDDQKRLKHIKSLVYCKDEVESMYDEWIANSVGKVENQENRKPEKAGDVPAAQTDSAFSMETIGHHLENVTSVLEKSKAKAAGDLREVLEEVLGRLSHEKENYTDNVQEVVIAYVYTVTGMDFDDGLIGAGLLRAVHVVLSGLLAPPALFLLMRTQDLSLTGLTTDETLQDAEGGVGE